MIRIQRKSAISSLWKNRKRREVKSSRPSLIGITLDISQQNYQIQQQTDNVLLSFIPNDNPIEKDTVDHIDMDKTNNRVENLRWLSRADNARAYQKQRKEVSADE